MAVRKSKRIALWTFLSLLLMFGVFLAIVNLTQGPTLIVNNCNDRYSTNSKICGSGTDYFYLNAQGEIHEVKYHSLDEQGEVYEVKTDRIISQSEEFHFLTCNSDYLYAADEDSLFQLNFRGEILRTINNEASEYGYFSPLSISGIYATDDCLFCVCGEYMLLDPVTLNKISIQDLTGGAEWTKSGEVYVCSTDDLKIVSGQIPDADSNGFVGIIVNKDLTVSQMVSYGHILLHNEAHTIGVDGRSADTIQDFCTDSEYPQSQPADFRHIMLDGDTLIAFHSDYKPTWLFNFCFGHRSTARIPQEYLFQDYQRENGVMDEDALSFHTHDDITILDLKSGSQRAIQTRKGERVLYITADFAITYYDGEYIYYRLKDWEKIRTRDAKKINSFSSYRFESCGGRIFLFDYDYDLKDILDIPFEYRNSTETGTQFHSASEKI